MRYPAATIQLELSWNLLPLFVVDAAIGVQRGVSTIQLEPFAALCSGRGNWCTAWCIVAKVALMHIARLRPLKSTKMSCLKIVQAWIRLLIQL